MAAAESSNDPDVKRLSAGVVRTDRLLMDGRTIRYYDTAGQKREAKDERPAETQPPIGEMRLDVLTNDWALMMSAMAACRSVAPP